MLGRVARPRNHPGTHPTVPPVTGVGANFELLVRKNTRSGSFARESLPTDAAYCSETWVKVPLLAVSVIALLP
jgi:hypothetical protein